MLLAVGLVAVFLAVFVAVVALVEGGVTRSRTTRTLRRLSSLESPSVAAVRQQELAAPMVERVIQPGLRRIAQFGLRITPVGVTRRLDETLMHAAITSLDGPRLLAIKLITTGAGVFIGLSLVPILTFIARLANPQAQPQPVNQAATLVGAIILGIIGYYLPEWIVRGRADARSQAIRRALPDALDLLSISVTAGLGFEAALDRVSREMRGELGVELYRVVQEMRLGQSRSDALRGLSDRTDVRELDSFVLAMVQAETFGVPIANVLATQADEMRIKRRQAAEEQAQKIPVKILFPLIACIFPVLFVVILGPPAIQIYENIIQGQ